MLFLKRAVTFAVFSALASSAWAASLPDTAKKASMEEFKAFADGRTVKVEILDAGVPVVGTLTWDWANETISGTALVNDTDTIDVQVKLLFEGEMACSQSEGSEPTCHTIWIDGDRFYEVTEEGDIHAISTLAS